MKKQGASADGKRVVPLLGSVSWPEPAERTAILRAPGTRSRGMWVTVTIPELPTEGANCTSSLRCYERSTGWKMVLDKRLAIVPWVQAPQMSLPSTIPRGSHVLRSGGHPGHSRPVTCGGLGVGQGDGREGGPFNWRQRLETAVGTRHHQQPPNQ